MHSVEAFLATYGPIFVLFGAAIEGNTVAITSGFLAHQGLISPWAVFLAAFIGTWLFDQALFTAGRRAASLPFLQRQIARPSFTRALGLVGRNPTPILLVARFVPGLRNVAPLAFAASHVPALRFFALNLLAAALWAAADTTLGYLFGGAIEAAGGVLPALEHKLGWAVAIAAAAYVVFHVVRWWRRRGTTPET